MSQMTVFPRCKDGAWFDEIPNGFLQRFVDFIFGAKYYRIFEYSRYTGKPCIARGYYRCPASLLPQLEKWCIEYRLYKIENTTK